jgi:signal peptide peptidase SppA
MSTLNPIYGFVGRSTNAVPMAVSAAYTGLPNVVRAALALGNNDPTEAHIRGYAAGLAKRRMGLPTDDSSFYYDDKLYAKSDSGMAFIPVWGYLFNKCDWACSGFTGYDFVQSAYSAALADSSVTSIVLDVDSYGGEVQGCMELADWLFAQRGKKPSMAIANANACSAGYAILSTAEHTSAIESSNVGSVGVVVMHVDYSVMLEQEGIKVSVLHAGAHKVDGNPYQPLPDDVRKEWQAELMKIRERFAGVVARNRAMSTDAVLATEARVYGGHEAVQIGFVDAVESPQAAVTAFFNGLTGSTTQELAMATNDKPGTPEVKTEQPTAADERSRIKAIVGCDEAKGREGLAEHLAFSTEMSADDAKKLLAAAPQKAEEKVAETNPFAAAMDATQNPNVGAEGGGNAAVQNDTTAALLRDYGMATGRKFDSVAKH